MSDKTTKLVFELFGRDKASPVFDRFGRRVDVTTKKIDLLAGATGKLGVAFGALSVGKVIKDSVMLEAAYSKTMRMVQVQTHASGAEMKSMDALALKLGADTVFSASDASGAMLELAKGGLTQAQIKAGALESSMTLAAAGSIELTEASEDTVNVMGAFELGASKTGDAVASLAGAANASSADVEDIAEALSQAGAQAHATGLSVEETTGILAAFANAGIKGSDAGTSLKTMLQNLVPHTKRQRDEMDRLNLSFVDSNGNFVSAEQIAGRLQTALSGLTQEQRASAMQILFGSDASRAANILMLQGSDGIRKYVQATSDKTAAEKLAKTSMEGTSGAIEQLKGSIETAEIQIGKGLAPVVQDVSKDMANWVQDAPIEKWAHDGANGVRDLATELAPLVKTALSFGKEALPVVAESGSAALTVLDGTLKVVGPLVEVFDKLPDAGKQALVLAGGLAMLNSKLPPLSLGTMKAEAGLLGIRTELGLLAARQNAAKIGFGAAGIAALTFADDVSEAGSTTNGFIKIAGATAMGAAFGGPWGAAIGGATTALSVFGGKSKDTVGDVSSLTATLDDQTAAFTKNTREMAKNELNKKLTSGPGKGLSTFELADQQIAANPGQVLDAALGNKEALGTIMASIDAILQNSGDAGTAPEDSPEGRAALALADALNITKERLAAARAEKLRDINATKQSIEFNKLSAAQIREVGKATKGIPKKVISQFTQPGYVGAVKNAAEIAHKYNLTPKQVKTTLTALDYSKPKIDAVLKQMERLDKKKAKPTVDLDTSGVDSGYAHVINTMNKIGGLSASAKASIHASDVGANAEGTPNWRGGPTWLHEKGAEIVDVPGGSRIYPHDKSLAMAAAAGAQSASASAGPAINEARLARLIGREVAAVFADGINVNQGGRTMRGTLNGGRR